MKKLVIIILSLILSISLCLPVLALDLNLIEDEKKEEIKDDYKEEEKKEVIEENYSKSAKPLNTATYIYFSYIGGYLFCWYTRDITSGDEYNIKFYIDNKEYILTPQGGMYFIRGQEGSANGSTADVYVDGIRERSIMIYGDSTKPNGYQLVDVGKYNPIPEPTPEPTLIPDEPIVSDNNVSWNSVSENLVSIEQQIRGLRKDVQNLADVTFSVSVSNINVSNNEVSTLSDDIIHKPLKEYSTAESMSLIGLMLAFTGLIVYVVHKSIYRWRR